MKAVSHALGSLKAARTSLDLMPEVEDGGLFLRAEGGNDEEGCPRPCCWGFSCRRRRSATFRSRGLRYEAVSGESGITPHAIVETMTDGKPSRRNKSRHEAIGRLFPTHKMNQAIKPAKADASGAAGGVR